MLTVYHGSTYRVEQPLAGVCRPNLDFGVGFYLTDLKDQAIEKLKAKEQYELYKDVEMPVSRILAQLIFAMKIVCGSIFIHWI